MTALRHPNITPPLLIEVEDDRVPEFTEAGWLLVEESLPTPDPVEPDEGPDSTEENTE